MPTNVADPFDFPLDGPMFKQRVDELEASAKRLKERSAALLNGAKKYRDGITAMLEAQLAFAAALTEFGGGTDEESLHLGSAVISQFIKVFKELAGFYDFLRTQLDLGLIERLQKDWLDGVLASGRDERRRYDRRASDYEAARVKHQSLKKLTKREVLERSHAELATARCAEEEGRFDLARRLTEVELSKRYAFLELVVGAVHAHLMFYRNGSELLGRLEGPINDALQIGEHLRLEESEKMNSLEDMIRVRKEAADRREGLIAWEVAALADSGLGGTGPGGSTAGTGGEGSHHHTVAGGGNSGCAPGGSVVLSMGPGGPVQMSAANSELMADIERLIRATRSTSGQQVTIIKQGYLSKRSQGKGRSDWKRRFFVLDSNGMMYYYSHKADSLMQLSRSVRPKNTLPLLTSTVKLDADEPAVRCAFRVVSPEGTYTLQAETEFERTEWIAALQGVINCLLNGAVDIATLPRVPVRPTHSRAGSAVDAALAAAMDGIPAAGRAAGTSAGGACAITPASSQPGTPLSGALSNIPSGDGSGCEDGGDGGYHQRVSSRLGGGSGISKIPGAAAAAAAFAAALGSGDGSGNGTLERLRLVPGNRRCADCGAQDPDWASLNLGVLLCIECSGVHRQVGVQVSKVRSCTLDVKVWEPQVISVFEAIGNEYSNKVWEACLPAPAAAPGPETAALAAPRVADSWVWCDKDSDGDESEGNAGGGAAAAGRGRSSSGGGGAAAGPDGRAGRLSTGGKRQMPLEGGGSVVAAVAAAAPPSASPTATATCKPSATSPLSDKSRFIQDKYVGRAYVMALPREQAQAKLWDAVLARDVRRALAALAAGADVNAPYRTPRAQRLVGEASARAAAVDHQSGGASSGSGASTAAGSGSGSGSGSRDGGQASEEGVAPPTVCGTVTALHLAAAMGDVPVLEFLLQNGAACQHTDAHGRTPLHYAVLHDAGECAKVLMRRNGAGGELQRSRDSRGRTPMDLAMAKGRVTDEELFILLTV